MSALTRNRRGITLIEAMVAIVVVSMTAVAALEVVASQLRLTERAHRALEAEALASVRMDYMALLTDPELQALPDTVEQGKFDPPMDKYSYEATSLASPEIQGVYFVTLRIIWPGNSYELHTQFYRRPQVRTASQ